jgi:hypothetical protein
MGPSLIPPPRDDDDEDVNWALSTAAALWQRGEKPEALRWLRKAAEHALDANRDDRSLELARLAADLGPNASALTSTPPPAPARPPSIPAPAASRPPPHPPPVRVGGSVPAPPPPPRASVPAPAVATPRAVAAPTPPSAAASSPLLQRRLGTLPGPGMQQVAPAPPPARQPSPMARGEALPPDPVTTKRAAPEPARAQKPTAGGATQPAPTSSSSAAHAQAPGAKTSSAPASPSASSRDGAASSPRAPTPPAAAPEPPIDDTRPRARRRTKTGTGPVAPLESVDARAVGTARAKPADARQPDARSPQASAGHAPRATPQRPIEPAPFDGFDEELTQQHATIVRAPAVSPQRFAEIEALARRPDDLDEETSVLSRLDDAASDASSTLDRTAQNWVAPEGLEAPGERAPDAYDPYATVREMPAVPSRPAPAEPARDEPRAATELAPPLAAIRVAVVALEGGGLRVLALGNDLAAPPGAAIAILVPVSEADSDFLKRELVG